MRVRKGKPQRQRRSPTLLERINPNAAGIDCGAAEHYVAVPKDRDPSPVRSFKTFTADLHRLAEWLAACGIKTVAMEATGVYWIPVFEILEARGFEVLLVNARHVRTCLVARATSPTPSGFRSFTASVYFAGAFGRLRTSQPYAATCDTARR